jgi:hypothetical protein
LERWMEEAAEPSRGLRLIQTQLVTRHGIRCVYHWHGLPSSEHFTLTLRVTEMQLPDT